MPVAHFFAIFIGVFSIGIIVYWLKRGRYAGVKDNVEFYKIRKDEDEDCPPYTRSSY